MNKDEIAEKIASYINHGWDDKEIASQIHLWIFSTLSQGPSDGLVALIALIRDLMTLPHARDL